ncbi:hypothetical protein DIPPA_14144 [Diplonema papillatum]|nr:hypothetical protein DIPPA_14144 [Diplonema papillatum]|eukprot:gene21655-33325_t
MADVLGRHEWKFVQSDAKKFEAFNSAGAEELLQKWDLAGANQVFCFKFDDTYRRGMADDFIQSFFNDASVRALLRVRDENGYLGFLGKGSIDSVQYDNLDATLVRMDMFDKLEDAGIVRDTGIRKMVDQFLPGGVTVSDELRNLFLNEDESEHAGLFSADDKNEFLYHVLWRLVAGGAMCQYEDDFGAYKQMAKSVYKDLVSVVKNPDTGRLETCCHVYSIKAIKGASTPPLFGRPQFSNHNFCYLSVNPVSRLVCVWYNAFASPF